MVKTEFYLFKIRIDPESGEDLLTCLNENGEGFDEAALKLAGERLYRKEAQSAGPDDGVLIQRVDQLFPGVSTDQTTALSYKELAEQFELEQGAR